MTDMLLDGINHVAVLTNDTDRLHAFYREVFDATVSHDMSPEPGFRLSFIDVGPHTELNVFQVDGNVEAEHQVPMFGRGRLDHMGLHAASLDAFDTIRERLMARARPTASSPTSDRSSASSSSIPTASRARSVS